ncbi:class V heat shock protein [Carex littledalei]|uniref:Class V heat shock protein n=1 Tax=Carex littledalei TaxID=544730 RepID=A0A833QP80_9POAL|nr:class V heat shock protein [Carex littledalei]
MEMHPILLRYSPWPLFFFHLQRSPFPPPNYVHWTETPTSHLYAANLPGLRKEEIRVEVEDSLYMVIRTELCNTGIGTEEEKEERMRQRSFNRKFRLPVRVDLEGITARYEDGVLTVTVPRLIRRPQIEYSGLDQEVKSVARAA